MAFGIEGHGQGFGAISLVISQPKLKWGFYAGMVGMGLLGTWYTYLAWDVARTAG